MIIELSGHSGAGKTIFAQALAARLRHGGRRGSLLFWCCAPTISVS
jgi:tRNA A37 threonylcarbamoyladenosine biosynthesis protein TsaE